jgi:N-methylhydantoinase B/oxoprolinase/acetone carboxylase alpha subunit
MLLTNDPWMIAGQVNDITVTTPIFKNGRVIGLFANTCHAADIGGRVLSAEAREVYEEGLRLPIMKLFDRGRPNDVLMRIVRANVRLPDEVIGDLHAQTACNDAGGRALLEMTAEFDSGHRRCDRRDYQAFQTRRARIRDFLTARHSETRRVEEPSWSAASSARPVTKSLLISPGPRPRAAAGSTLC